VPVLDCRCKIFGTGGCVVVQGLAASEPACGFSTHAGARKRDACSKCSGAACTLRLVLAVLIFAANLCFPLLLNCARQVDTVAAVMKLPKMKPIYVVCRVLTTWLFCAGGCVRHDRFWSVKEASKEEGCLPFFDAAFQGQSNTRRCRLLPMWAVVQTGRFPMVRWARGLHPEGARKGRTKGVEKMVRTSLVTCRRCRRANGSGYTSIGI